jgi:hypothetical protein
MFDANDMDPEEVFKLITVMPRHKIRVMTYLEDDAGDRITLKELAVELVDFINKNMEDPEKNVINAQLFPLTAQFMGSLVPRFVGIQASTVLFGASSFRRALTMTALGTALLMQYIQQHGLKIVTETETVTDQEIESLMNVRTNSDKMINNLFNTFSSTEEDDEDEDDDEG